MQHHIVFFVVMFCPGRPICFSFAYYTSITFVSFLHQMSLAEAGMGKRYGLCRSH